MSKLSQSIDEQPLYFSLFDVKFLFNMLILRNEKKKQYHSTVINTSLALNINLSFFNVKMLFLIFIYVVLFSLQGIKLLKTTII